MWSRWLDSARGFEKRICHHFSQGSCSINPKRYDSDVFDFPQNSGWFGNCGHCVGGGERPADLLCWIWVTTNPPLHTSLVCTSFLEYLSTHMIMWWDQFQWKLTSVSKKADRKSVRSTCWPPIGLTFAIFDLVLIELCPDLAPKVYVCPPNFVLDHDWLAIPKVTTVCRVSLLKSAQI